MSEAAGRACAALRRLRDAEQGLALPVALLTTAIGFTFASVVVVASVQTQSGDSHDQASSSALAAAEAGADLAILRQNRLGSATDPCVVEVKAGGQSSLSAEGLPRGGEWCAASTLSELEGLKPAAEGEINGATYRYSVKPCYLPSCNLEGKNGIAVVAVGSAMTGGHPVASRIQVMATADPSSTEPSESFNPFDYGQVVGIESLVMNNNAQVYHGGVSSNGTVSLEGSANVCGTVQYGKSYVARNGSESAPWYCASNGRTFVKGTTEYPAVTLPSNISSYNSNGLLKSVSNTVSWSSSTKTLIVQNRGPLTLSGTAPYELCRLEVTGGGSLKAASGAKIHIYFDEPSQCPSLKGNPQLRVWNGAQVYADSGDGPVFLFVGSKTPGASTIELQGGSTTQQEVIYAPSSTIKIANGITTNGIIIGQTLELGGGASINEKGVFSPPSSEGWITSPQEPETAEGHDFSRGSYVECSAQLGGGKWDSGC